MKLFDVKNVNFKDLIYYKSVEINALESTAICGKSGCGKSTLLKLLNCVENFNSGEILYNAKDITSFDTIQLRREVLLCSQSVFLWDNTIKENFESYYKFLDKNPPEETLIKKYLELCCFDLPLDTNCKKLSGGERQRVYLAIAISFLPKVLLLDEPTSALDDDTSNKFFKNITNFCKEKEISLIFISHNMEIAKKYADNLIILEGKYE